jgi:dihydrodipicolinate synthase/N-acetylneuraminate lyase
VIAPPQGMICPVVTTLRPDGQVNADVFAAHLDQLVPHLDGVFVLGSCGEHPWLSDQAQADVVRIAAETVGGRLPLFVGVGQPDLGRVRRRIAERAGSGADYLVLTPPTFFPLGPSEVVDFYTQVADESPLPVLLYNIPQYAGNAITAGAARQLADHPNIVGIKDSSGDFGYFQELLLDRPSGFSVLQGREPLAAASVALGADGLVASLLNFAAPLVRSVAEAATKGPSDDLADLQRELTTLSTLADHGGLIPALKAALELCGVPAGPPLAPVRPVSDAERSQIAALVDRPRQRGWLN